MIASTLAEASSLVAPPNGHTFGFRRVTSREAMLFLQGKRFENLGGIAVARLDATDDTNTTDDDDEVTLVAVDRDGDRIYTNAGLLQVLVWDGSGTSVGKLSSPRDVAIDRAGNIAVTDPGNRRVVFLRHTGKALEVVAAHDGFSEPTGVAADGIGGFWVCDRALGTLFHIDGATGRRRTFGLEVPFERPIAVATIPEGDRLARGKKRALVVVDRDGERLRSFDVGGALGGARNAAELGVGAARFDDVDIDYYGNVLAVDREHHRIHKFRQDLYPLDTFGTSGTRVGEFLSPRGIAIHRSLGQVFLTEHDGGQYLWVGTDVRDVRAEPTGQGVSLSFVLTEDSSLELDIVDASGRPVAHILGGDVRRAGPQDGTWDGTDSSGRRVANGAYVARIRARATYASRSTFTCEVRRSFQLGPGGAK